MSWSSPVPAVSVRADLESAVLATTSTCTISITALLSPDLRMFGINTKSLNNAFQAVRNGTMEPPFTAPAPLGKYESCQEFLDSDGTSNFAADAATNAVPMTSTAVPFQTAPVTMGYVRTTSRTVTTVWQEWGDYGGLYPTVTVTESDESGEFYVVYKDVHVVEMPAASRHQGWLMLVGRYRVRNDGDVTGFDDVLNSRCLPGRSFGDIVAFWSPDNSFASVVGPIPLVTSSTGVTDPAASPTGPKTRLGFRCWLGVPAGVFYGSDLHVYYSVRPDFDDVTGLPYLDDSTQLDDAIQAFDEGIFGSLSGLDARTYVARLSLDTLDTLLDSPPAEADWDTVGSWPSVDLARPVRLWYPAVFSRDSTESRLAVTRLEGVVSPGVTPWFVDATPMMCVLNLVLFVSVQPNVSILSTVDLDEDTRYGIWVGRAFPAGQTLGDGEVSVFGVDFICGWQDLVVQSWTDGVDDFIYKDPDPVLLLSGWRVYTGNVTEASDGSLDYAEGPLDCFSWRDALLATPVAEAELFAALDARATRRHEKVHAALARAARPVPWLGPGRLEVSGEDPAAWAENWQWSTDRLGG